MKVPRWEDLATRARGLTTHLLDRAALASLATADGLDAVAAALRGHGFPISEGGVSADDLELAVRRQSGHRLAVLARWAGSRHPLLAIVFEDEDRRSLRALVRGAVQGAPAESRLAGLIPTPALPEKALRELAAQPAPGAIAVLLTAWGSAYGAPLLREAKVTQPDLLAIESGLNVTFAHRALQGARASGSTVLVDYVRDTIDFENATTGLVLVGTEADAPAKRAFIEGGRRMSLAAFLDAVAAGDAAAAGVRLAAAFRPAAAAVAAFERAGSPATIEEELLRARIAMLHEVERRDPAGIAAVLEFALRVRAEVLALRRVIWGVVLAAPRATVGAG